MMAQKPLKQGSNNRIEIEEIDESTNVVATYVTTHGGETRTSRIDVLTPANKASYAKIILDVFLPAGYPHSVTPDYLEYQIYDSLQAFSSSIAGLLSSRALLEGIGVGNSDASPTAAILLSVLQTSMGRIATILFAHRFGTSLEPECKMYRLSADIFNDSAMILDCISPAFPKSSRVILLSTSSVLRSLCGVAAGSSKASLSAHFATQGNLGELNAKDSSQETIISLMGMWAGSLVVSRITTKSATWIAMIILLSIHLGTNYLAVRAVSMRTLNRQRANLLFSSIFEHAYYSRLDMPYEEKRRTPVRILSPEQISTQERIFERDGVLRWEGGEILGYCRIGVDLKVILECLGKSHPASGSYNDNDFAKLLSTYEESQYIMHYDESRKTFLIALKIGATTETQLQAWGHALWHAGALRRRKQTDEKSTLDDLARTRGYVKLLYESCGFDMFKELSKAGWDVKTAALETRSGTRIKLKDSA